MISGTDKWSLGKWYVMCPRCGRNRTNDMVLKEPETNLMVCRDGCWDPRHPQDFVRGKPDNMSVPYPRPEPTDQFVEVTYADTGPSADIPSGTFNNDL